MRHAISGQGEHISETIVIECVEGKTLAEVIPPKGLRLAQALPTPSRSRTRWPRPTPPAFSIVI